MNGNIAQQIALISFGNEFLRTNILSVDFYPGNSTFQFYNSVCFFDFQKSFFSSKLKETLIANSPYEWFKLLKKDKCQKLRISYEHSKDQSFAKDYKLAGFVGGGGTWLIESVYPAYSTLWANNHTVTMPNAQDNRIWSAKYGIVSKFHQTVDLYYDLEQIKEALEWSLISIRNFAEKHTLDFWVETFEKAITALSSNQPNKEYYHKDLLDTTNHQLIAQQIIFASGTAFVFGGMGSWNDIGFDTVEEQKAYNDLTEDLYETVIKAIVASINS